ncbi:hypothetical protein ACRAQ6_02950 [Erythrobacter sp. HA6-11]
MLLRRITQNVKDQNWTAIGIDFLIVVVGVFLGIQIGNWNEDRAETRQGQDYTNRVIADLEGDLDIFRSSSTYFGAVQDSILKADRLLAEPNSDPRALVIETYRASEFMLSPQNRSTWQQVVSSGDLDLLPQQSLHNGLADYYRFDPSSDSSFAFLQDSPYRRLVRSVIPLKVQLDLRDNCSDVLDELNYVVGFQETCNLTASDAELAEAAVALRSSPGIRQDLRNQYSIVSIIHDNASGNIPVVEGLIEMLEEETQP